MSKPEYTFLLVDDQKSEMDAFINAGKLRRILIHAVDNVEDGIAKLKADPDRYEAVILDAKCKLRRGDLAESINESALRKAISDLDAMAKATGRMLLRCIYTGNPEAAANNELTEKVFRKGGPGTEAALFDYLIGAIKHDPRNVVVRRYEDVLSMFSSGHLPIAGKEDLVHLLMELDDLNPSKVTSNLTRVRRALEMMLRQLHEFDDHALPAHVLNSISGVSESIHFLAAKGSYAGNVTSILPEHLFNILYTTQKVTSKAGAHFQKEFVSHYAMRSLAYGLLEALLWFKNFVDENYPDQLSK